MNLLKSIKNNIPNTITCLNLLSGAIACILATSGSEHIGGNLDNLTYYQLSFCMIAAAAVFDFLDGFAARLLNAVSSIGKELDSLSDCVSFGLAPDIHRLFHDARHISRLMGGIHGSADSCFRSGETCPIQCRFHTGIFFRRVADSGQRNFLDRILRLVLCRKQSRFGLRA